MVAHHTKTLTITHTLSSPIPVDVYIGWLKQIGRADPGGGAESAAGGVRSEGVLGDVRVLTMVRKKPMLGAGAAARRTTRDCQVQSFFLEGHLCSASFRLQLLRRFIAVPSESTRLPHPTLFAHSCQPPSSQFVFSYPGFTTTMILNRHDGFCHSKVNVPCPMS